MSDRTVITQTNLQAYFQSSVTDALRKQGVATQAETEHYIVNLLTSFSHTERLYPRGAGQARFQPLAHLYAEALGSESPVVRNQLMQRLGDVALFIAGVFADSLNRRLVDVDYYISMGGAAYSYLSDSGREGARWRAMAEVFDELAQKFVEFVDILAEVCEGGRPRHDADILRLYEIWLRTGSRRAARQLRNLGIEPDDQLGADYRH